MYLMKQVDEPSPRDTILGSAHTFTNPGADAHARIYFAAFNMSICCAHNVRKTCLRLQSAWQPNDFSAASCPDSTTVLTVSACFLLDEERDIRAEEFFLSLPSTTAES